MNNFLSILIVLFCLVRVHSQYAVSVNYGITGSKLNWIGYITPLNDYESLTTFESYGLDIRKSLSQNWDIQIGFKKFAKGGIEHEHYETGLPEILRLDYLSTNFQIKGHVNIYYEKIPMLKKFSIYGTSGPRMDFRTKLDEVGETLSSYVDINSFSYGFYNGLGLECYYNKFGLGLQAAHFLNFMPISNRIASINGARIRDFTFEFTIHVSYRFGKN